MTHRFLNAPYGGALVALMIAGIFAVVVPSADQVVALEGLPFIIVRWFHSLVWVLLALSFFLRGTRKASLRGLADMMGILGGLCYAAYLITSLQVLK
jgi:hypothetical protein